MMMRNSSCSSLNTTTTSGSDGEGARAAAGSTTVLKKGPWTAAEDAILMEYVQKHGEGNWNSVQKNSGLSRCGKSCRLRWANHLRPNLKKGSFTPEEEMLILQLHAQLGNKWARMAAQLPGRTDNEIKNYWNTRVKRRQRAGLPLYPADLQLQQAAQVQAHHHHRRSMGSLRPPPLMVPPSSSSAPSSPLQHPPVLLQSPASMPLLLNYAMPETPRVKKVRDDGLTFQFPLSPAVSPHMQQQQHHYRQMAANNNNNNMFQYNYLSMPLPARMELPSTQLFNNGGGGGGESTCGLLDALLQEAQGVGGNVMQRRLLVSDSIGAVKDENGGSGGGKDSFEFEESSQCSNGMNAKSERAGEMTPASTHDDVSKLFDMISTSRIPAAASEWYNNDNAAAGCCEISNGEQSSVSAAGDELSLELQHLASSLSVAPAEQDWNIGSCSWSNMPGIC